MLQLRAVYQVLGSFCHSCASATQLATGKIETAMLQAVYERSFYFTPCLLLYEYLGPDIVKVKRPDACTYVVQR
ncbi:unnamed protein product, partial [Ascophyllum nodosum]